MAFGRLLVYRMFYFTILFPKQFTVGVYVGIIFHKLRTEDDVQHSD